MPKPRILLADDGDASLKILRNLLEPEFEVVASVRNGEALVKAAKALTPDLIVTDITMPRLNGFEAARQLKAVQPNARIVFITTHAEPAFVAEARKCHTRGYVIKQRAHSDLLPALRRALRNGPFFSSALQE